MAALMEFAIFPTDKGSHVSVPVSKVIQMIKESGYQYQLTAMGTLVEAPTIGELLSLIEKAVTILEIDSSRIYSTVRFDIKKGATNMLDEKVRAIENNLY